jgi:UDP-4-amino-4,6-dideoxy-N-acetyl-beta-L-altrosamine N-acetyltransferase
MTIRFVDLSEEHLEQVLNWRTKESVTKFMFTDMEYNLEKQRQWFEKIRHSKTNKNWIITYDEYPIGLFTLSDIDLSNNKSSWAYYIGEADYTLLGGVFPAYVYNYALGILKFNKMTIEVMEGNEKVRKIHKLFGCREVGILKQQIYKYNKYHDVYLYEILRVDWEKNGARYQKYVPIVD